MNNRLETEWLTWNKYLSEFKDKKLNILEIGSYEGVATNWFLTYLMNNKDSKIYCIDTWEGSPEYVNTNFKKIEKTFNKMVKESGKKKQVIKMKMTSFEGLNKLISKKINDFDIIYIDASHLAKDVISDMILAWSILKYEGIMILDDYEWEQLGYEINRPKIAINTFIDFYKRELDVLSIKYQVLLQKKHIKKVNHILLMNKDNVLDNLLKRSYNYFNKLVLLNNDNIKKTDFHFEFTYGKKKLKRYDICYARCGFDSDIIKYNLLKKVILDNNESSLSYALFKFIFPYKMHKKISILNKLYLFKIKHINENLIINNIINELNQKVNNRKDKNDIIKLYNKILSDKEDPFYIYFVYYYKYIDIYLDNNINILYYKYNFNNNGNKLYFFNILDNCKKVNSCEYYYSDHNSKNNSKMNNKSKISDNYLNFDKINNKKSDFIFIHADFYNKIELLTNEYNVFLIYLLYFILFKQKEKGLLIIQGFKIPNHSAQIDFIYILSLFYKEINIDKLDITDKCSIELTIYGIGFKGIDKDLLNELKDYIDKIEYNDRNYKEFKTIFKINKLNDTIMNKIINYNKEVSSKIVDIYKVIMILYDYLNRKELNERVNFINEYFIKSIDLFIKYYDEYGTTFNRLIK